MDEIPALARQWLEEQRLYFYEDMVLPAGIDETLIPKLKSFEFDDSDVLISTYPRSGTTWTQEMTWLICNNADTEAAKIKDLEERAPFIEFTEPTMKKPNLEILENTPPPRVIKTHFPPQFYEQFGKGKYKIIMVMRNVKDVAVSCFHFYRNLFGFKGTWDDFFEMFKKDIMFYGSWLKHCLKCWELKDDPNVLLLKYEDTQRDHAGTILKIANFVGKTLTEEQVDTITNYTKVGNMKKVYESSKVVKRDESYKSFIRKGVVGEWSKWFNEEQLDFVNSYLKEAEQHGLFFADNLEK